MIKLNKKGDYETMHREKLITLLEKNNILFEFDYSLLHFNETSSLWFECRDRLLFVNLVEGEEILSIDQATKNVLEGIVDFIEEEAKVQGVEAILIVNDFEKELKLSEKGYYKNENTNRGVYIKDITKEGARSLLQFSKEWKKALKDKHTKDKTFQYYFNGNYHLRFKRTAIYCQGADITIEISVDKKGWTGTFSKEKKIKSQSPERLVAKLIEEIETIEKKQRIKNLMDPPKKYFNDILRIGIGIRNQTIINKMYEHLNYYYHAGEIEEKMATIEKKDYSMINRNHVLFIRLLDHLFVRDDRDVYHFERKKEEEAIALYRKLANKKFQEQLDYDVTSIIK